MVRRLADELNYIGVLAVEMFVVGDTHELIVNEIAPRPHNSGHHTIDACATNQFQQQVRIMWTSPCQYPSVIALLHGKHLRRCMARRWWRTQLAVATNPHPLPPSPIWQKKQLEKR